MNNKLQVAVKTVYGNELIYPVCDMARSLCELANTKTFTESAIRTCKKMGFMFELVILTTI